MSDADIRRFHLAQNRDEDPRRKFLLLAMDTALQGTVNWEYVADRIIELKLLLDKHIVDMFFANCENSAAREILVPALTKLLRSLARRANHVEERSHHARRLLHYATWNKGYPELRSDCLVFVNDLYEGKPPPEVRDIMVRIESRIMRSRRRDNPPAHVH